MVEIAKCEALPPQTPIRVLVACQMLQIERCRLCNRSHRREHALIDVHSTFQSSSVRSRAAITMDSSM
jgi:hypothetical protein